MNLLEFEQNGTDGVMRFVVLILGILGYSLIMEMLGYDFIHLYNWPASPIFLAFPPLHVFAKRGRELNNWYGEEVEHLVAQDAEERGFDWRAPEMIRRAVVGRMLAVERMNAE